MVDNSKLTKKERMKMELQLLKEVERIGEMVKEITPDAGHLSMTWYPTGHANVLLFSGKNIKHEDGRVAPVMLLDAWVSSTDGEVYRA